MCYDRFAYFLIYFFKVLNNVNSKTLVIFLILNKQKKLLKTWRTSCDHTAKNSHSTPIPGSTCIFFPSDFLFGDNPISLRWSLSSAICSAAEWSDQVAKASWEKWASSAQKNLLFIPCSEFYNVQDTHTPSLPPSRQSRSIMNYYRKHVNE